MSLLAIILSLAALVAAVALWLVATASHDRITQRFPEYAHRIFRTRRTLFQEGPVRLLQLLSAQPPAGADASISLLRCLAFIFTGSTLTAVLLWCMN